MAEDSLLGVPAPPPRPERGARAHASFAAMDSSAQFSGDAARGDVASRSGRDADAERRASLEEAEKKLLIEPTEMDVDEGEGEEEPPPPDRKRAREGSASADAAPSKMMRPSAPGSDRPTEVESAQATREREALEAKRAMREAQDKLRAKAAATAASRDARERVSDPELAAAKAYLSSLEARFRDWPTNPRTRKRSLAQTSDPHWYPAHPDRPEECRARDLAAFHHDDTRAHYKGFVYPATARDLAEVRRRGVIGLPREGARVLRDVIYEDTPVFLCATDLGPERHHLAVDVEVYRPTDVYPKITPPNMPPRCIDRAAFGGRFPAQVAVEPWGSRPERRDKNPPSSASNPSEAEPRWLHDFDGLRSKRLRALLAEATVDADGRPMPVALSREDALALAEELARERSRLVARDFERSGRERGVVAVAVETARKRTRPTP